MALVKSNNKRGTMKAMKVKNTMKAKNAMKAKKVSTVARGRAAKALVFGGRREKTAGGVTAAGLTKNKRGRIVSKRRSANGKRDYKRLEDWTEACMEARRVLNAQGFVPVNGRTLQGQALYFKAKALLQHRRAGGPASSSAAAAQIACTLG
mmetsp:Transcript_72233/g.199201  ORF Transcript_72233/g.199201 Transcript_72233/m.199201 type:complete len:151 (+) Transcript_72233:124-576(+)